MTAKVSGIWAWGCKNKVSVLKGLISLTIVMGLAVIEINILLAPGFTWTLVCAVIFISEMRNLKFQKARHAKPYSMRQPWIVACMALPVLYLQPWTRGIEISNPYESVATLFGILFLSFYVGFCSIRSTVSKSDNSTDKVFWKIAANLIVAFACECAVMVGAITWMILENSLVDWMVLHSVLSFAVIVVSMFTTYKWCLPIMHGDLMSHKMRDTCAKISTIFELTLTCLSVYLIGCMTPSTGFELEYKLYLVAALILSCYIPLKISLEAQDRKERLTALNWRP